MLNLLRSPAKWNFARVSLVESLNVPPLTEIAVPCRVRGKCGDNSTVLVERSETFFEKYEILSAAGVTKIRKDAVFLRLTNFTLQSKFLSFVTIAANISRVNKNDVNNNCCSVLSTVLKCIDEITEVSGDNFLSLINQLKLDELNLSDAERGILVAVIKKPEVALRIQPSRPRTLKKFEAKAKDRVAEDRLPQGQTQKGSRPRPRTRGH